MTYHHNPIEPSDWSDGPDEWPECDTCGGEGEVMGMVCYGGAPVERMQPCPDCNGKGFIEPDTTHFDDDVI